MFEKTKLKLTFWYLLIIMAISLFFSVAIYQNINTEYQRIEHRERLNEQRIGLGQNRLLPKVERINIDESRERLLTYLAWVNLLILALSGIAGYFLAGRTLRPIKQMVEDQERFISDASHELRTPITSLRSEIEVNLRDKKLSLKEAKSVLQSNLEEIKNLQGLSEELILLAQNKKTKSFNLKKINLTVSVEEGIKKVLKIAKAKNTKIKSNTQNLFILGDQEAITNLIVILLDNSIKYSPRNSKVEINSYKSGRNAIIDVIDNGIGIDNKDIDHIFDRFFRAQKSRTEDGYGLGLSIANKIVDQHNGSIKVTNLAKGTKFSVSLPTLKI